MRWRDHTGRDDNAVGPSDPSPSTRPRTEQWQPKSHIETHAPSAALAALSISRLHREASISASHRIGSSMAAGLLPCGPALATCRLRRKFLAMATLGFYVLQDTDMATSFTALCDERDSIELEREERERAVARRGDGTDRSALHERLQANLARLRPVASAFTPLSDRSVTRLFSFADSHDHRQGGHRHAEFGHPSTQLLLSASSHVTFYPRHTFKHMPREQSSRLGRRRRAEDRGSPQTSIHFRIASAVATTLFCIAALAPTSASAAPSHTQPRGYVGAASLEEAQALRARDLPSVVPPPRPLKQLAVSNVRDAPGLPSNGLVSNGVHLGFLPFWSQEGPRAICSALGACPAVIGDYWNVSPNDYR